MGNLGKPRFITSCHFTNIELAVNLAGKKVFSENSGHSEPMKVVIINSLGNPLLVLDVLYSICNLPSRRHILEIMYQKCRTLKIRILVNALNKYPVLLKETGLAYWNMDDSYPFLLAVAGIFGDL